MNLVKSSIHSVLLILIASVLAFAGTACGGGGEAEDEEILSIIDGDGSSEDSDSNPGDEQEVVELTDLSIDQNSYLFALEESSVAISGWCESDHGEVTIEWSDMSATTACEDDSWSHEFTHDDFEDEDTYENTVDVSQNETSLSTLIEHETIAYVCTNATEDEISDRGLEGDCDSYEADTITSNNGADVVNGANECTSDCPVVSEDGVMEFESGNEPVQIESSEELTADVALTLFVNFHWTGASLNLAGQPASMILEKGESDDDNYGIYVWAKNNRVCFEYNTEDLDYRSYCVQDSVYMNQDHSFAVVFSHADETIELYVDGVLQKTETETKKLRNNDFPLTIGQQNYPGNEFHFYGAIADVTVLKESLSAEDIALLHDVTNN